MGCVLDLGVIMEEIVKVYEAKNAEVKRNVCV